MDDKGKPDRVDVARAAPPPGSVINRRAFVLTGRSPVVRLSKAAMDAGRKSEPPSEARLGNA